VHTASPFPIAAPKKEDELIKPALEGTTAVLKACHQNKVKRLVITSSIAAIMVNDKEGVYTVDDWSILEKCQPYEKSKTVAERAAWDFQKKFKEEHDLEIVTINPGLVMGPNLNKAQFSSGDIVKRVMMNDLPGMPKVQMPSVDVRDVAKAHLNAILIPEAAN
jgi:dihydroflavonol-4-reductase